MHRIIQGAWVIGAALMLLLALPGCSDDDCQPCTCCTGAMGMYAERTFGPSSTCKREAFLDGMAFSMTLIPGAEAGQVTISAWDYNLDPIALEGTICASPKGLALSAQKSPDDPMATKQEYWSLYGQLECAGSCGASDGGSDGGDGGVGEGYSDCQFNGSILVNITYQDATRNCSMQVSLNPYTAP
jgi:hypothetical protein